MTCSWGSRYGRARSRFKRISRPQTTNWLSTVCLSESLVSAWSLVLIHIPGWNHFSDTIGADPDLPLHVRRSSSIGFEKVVVMFAQQAQVG